MHCGKIQMVNGTAWMPWKREGQMTMTFFFFCHAPPFKGIRVDATLIIGSFLHLSFPYFLVVTGMANVCLDGPH